jgi:formyltetrahydrofolate deformylase
VNYILTLSCPDRPGIVAAVSGLLASYGGNILESQQYGDPVSGMFFLRMGFTAEDSVVDAMRAAFATLEQDFEGFDWHLRDAAERMRVLSWCPSSGTA